MKRKIKKGDFMIILTLKFKDIREDNGYTQSELGDCLGISKNAISSIERGEYLPSITTVLKYMIFFNCDFNDLFEVNTDYYFSDFGNNNEELSNIPNE